MALRPMTFQLGRGADLGTWQSKVTISDAIIAGTMARVTSGERSWILADINGLICIHHGP